MNIKVLNDMVLGFIEMIRGYGDLLDEATNLMKETNSLKMRLQELETDLKNVKEERDTSRIETRISMDTLQEWENEVMRARLYKKEKFGIWPRGDSN